MTAGLQCDTCRTFASQTAVPWLYLVRQTAEQSFLSSLSSALGYQPADPATFCSMRCLAEFAYVQLAAGGAATGTEAQP